MKMLKQMTDEEIKSLKHNRIRPLWRRLSGKMVFRPDGTAILDGLWDFADAELRRRKEA